MHKDLSLIFGLNSRFGTVLGRIWRFFAHRVRFISLNSLVYQRVLGRCFSNLLEDGPPALPVIFLIIFRSLISGHCRMGGVVRL
jgi:hypothetical protein